MTSNKTLVLLFLLGLKLTPWSKPTGITNGGSTAGQTLGALMFDFCFYFGVAGLSALCLCWLVVLMSLVLC